MGKKLTIEKVKEYIEKEGYNLLSDTYINNKTKLEMQCPEGHKLKMIFNSFQTGNRCCICFGKKKFTYEYVKEQFEKEGYKLLSDTYVDNITKLKVQCPEGHKFGIRLNHFKTGIRCAECAGNKKHTYEFVKVQIEKEGYEILSKEYKNNETKLQLQCPKGHKMEMKWSSFNRGERCPICWEEQSFSKPEKEVLEIVKSFTGELVVENDRTQIINPKTGNNLELDVWIP